MFARDQLSVIKIYFKESQITLCTNGKGMGDRSRARQGEAGIFMSKCELLIGRITRGRNCLSLGRRSITIAPPRQLLYFFSETLYTFQFLLVGAIVRASVVSLLTRMFAVFSTC